MEKSWHYGSFERDAEHAELTKHYQNLSIKELKTLLCKSSYLGPMNKTELIRHAALQSINRTTPDRLETFLPKSSWVTTTND